MSHLSKENLHEYVYRRVCPPSYKEQRNTVDSEAFKIKSSMKGLSVFRADKTTPYAVLQARIEAARAKLDENWLKKNPTPEVLVEEKGYRIVCIPISKIEEMGFSLEEPDSTGHLNILGSAKEFEDRAEDFVELIDMGEAFLLDKAGCLQKQI